MPLEQADFNGLSPLVCACQHGINSLAIVQLLVEAGADVNFTVHSINMTALHWAAFNGDVDTCGYLLAVGAAVTYSSQDYTAVDIAGICNYPELVQYFAETLSARVSKPFAAEHQKLGKTMNQSFQISEI